MRVLLVEPWFGGSHAAWANGYRRHSTHDVELLTLPDEAWRWRLRGAALTLAQEFDHRPDVVLASSMLDVAQFLGHARRLLAGVPVVLYMHENQLTYPLPEGTQRDMDAALTNWTSMAAADHVVFNSEHHRTSWFGDLPQMLRTMPEPRHGELVEEVRARSSVAPVGVELEWLDDPPEPDPGPPLIVWNHRWEHDKRPDLLVGAIRRLLAAGVEFRLAVLGEAPTGMPEVFERLPELLGDRLVQFGFAPRLLYEQLLGTATVVLSTADHEFFGVAVVEAMAAGARPVLPARLSYPELVPDGLAADTLFATRGELDRLLVEACAAGRGSMPAVAEHVQRFAWPTVAPVYDRLLESVAG